MIFVFAAAIFLSSGLLFWLEPLFGKMVLPFLGGAPPAWNACILFYQAALIAGYAWAHLSDRIGARRHLTLHLALSIAALSVLPFAVPASLLPPPPDHPLRWVLLVLAVGIGLPFVLVSANGPLLQRVFSHSGARQARDPYFLYAASNLGSAASLLLYPAAFERFMTLREQREAWRIGYVALLALLVACAFVVWKRLSAHHLSAPVADEPIPAEPIALSRRLKWVALAAIPSSLMLGVTTYISSEVAPVPLLWILPLAIYLGTLVVAYGMTQRLSARPALTALSAVAVIGGPWLAWFAWGSRGAVVALHLVLFAIAALICHARLAADRPSPARLTEYFLWTSIGGGVGGLFNTLVGPLIFTSVLEYPLALAAVIMVLPARRAANGDLPPFSWRDVVFPALVGLGAAAIPLVLDALDVTPPFPPRLLLAVPALSCLAFSGRPIRFGGGLAAIIVASGSYPSEIGSIEHAERNFYSVHRVLRDDRHGFRWLTHGVTVHGGQRLADTVTPYPLTYYTPAGPAGDVFRALAAAPDREIGVIGLGAGALMYFAVPGQRWTFFEIDPAVTAIAQDPRYFGFLPRARAPYRVIDGDARLSLAADSARYDVLVLDAFASDAIPVHLLTREALALYRSRLKPGGVILMHISSRFFDLGPIVGVMARDAGMIAQHRRDVDPDDLEVTGKFGSHWALLVGANGGAVSLPHWRPLEGGAIRVWTDDYSSVLPLIKRRDAGLR